MPLPDFGDETTTNVVVQPKLPDFGDTSVVGDAPKLPDFGPLPASGSKIEPHKKLGRAAITKEVEKKSDYTGRWLTWPLTAIGALESPLRDPLQQLEQLPETLATTALNAPTVLGNLLPGPQAPLPFQAGKPIIQIPEVQQPTETAQAIYDAMRPRVEGLTTPGNLAMLGLAPQGALGRTAPLAKAFTLPMAKGVVEEAPQVLQAYKDPHLDYLHKATAIAGLTVDSMLTGLGVLGMGYESASKYTPQELNAIALDTTGRHIDDIVGKTFDIKSVAEKVANPDPNVKLDAEEIRFVGQLAKTNPQQHAEYLQLVKDLRARQQGVVQRARDVGQAAQDVSTQAQATAQVGPQAVQQAASGIAQAAATLGRGAQVTAETPHQQMTLAVTGPIQQGATGIAAAAETVGQKARRAIDSSGIAGTDYWLQQLANHLDPGQAQQVLAVQPASVLDVLAQVHDRVTKDNFDETIRIIREHLELDEPQGQGLEAFNPTTPNPRLPVFAPNVSSPQQGAVPTKEPEKIYSSSFSGGENLPVAQEKPLNPGGALKDLSPELQSQHAANTAQMRADYERLKAAQGGSTGTEAGISKPPMSLSEPSSKAGEGGHSLEIPKPLEGVRPETYEGGKAITYTHDGRIRLVNIETDVAERGKGYAGKFLQELKKRNMPIELDVASPELKQFYKKQGFVQGPRPTTMIWSPEVEAKRVKEVTLGDKETQKEEAVRVGVSAPKKEKPPLRTKEENTQRYGEGRAFVTETEKQMHVEKPFGITKTKEGEVSTATLLSKMKGASAEEREMLDEAGLQEFLKGKPSVKPEEVAKWVKENGPKVEVRKFGEGQQSDSQRAYYKMQHEWADSLDYEIGKSVKSALREARDNGTENNADYNSWRNQAIEDFNNKSKSIEERKVFRQNLDKFVDLGIKVANEPKSESSHWQSISPKPESEMKGYTEIAVVRPRITMFDLTPEQKASGKYVLGKDEVKFPSSHSFPPNTLAWVRGHMETTKDGRKVFLIHEVQSDWAQKYNHEFQLRLQDAEQDIGTRLGDYVNVNSDAMKRYREMGFTPDTILSKDNVRQITHADVEHLDLKGDPLLSHYESLALKAAIEHARSEGADAFAVLDSKSAMMVEGHDRGVKQIVGRGTSREVALQNLRHQSSDYSPLDESTIKVNKEGQMYIAIGETSITQQKGMTQHYDLSLPNIAKKLTGEEGKLESFGEHKMARDFSNGREDVNANPLRKDLIFRNPDGSLKTDVTARVYPLRKVAARLESKEPMQMTGSKLFMRPDLGVVAGIRNAPQLVKDAAKKLQTARGAFPEWWRRRNVTSDTIPAMKDAADTEARVLARQETNEAIQALHTKLGAKPTSIQRMALTAVIEARGDILALDKFKKQVSSIDTSYARSFVQAIDYAKKYWLQLSDAAKTYEAITKSQLKEEREAGIPTEMRNGYVPHIQDVHDDNAILFERGTGGTGKGSYTKERVYESYADSIKAGVKPVSLDPFDLLEHRLSAGKRRVNSVEMARSLSKMKDPGTGTPIIRSLIVKKTKEGKGKLQTTTPSGYKEMFIGNSTVAVHNGYVGLFKSLTGDSSFNNGIWGRGVMSTVSLAKHTTLLFDLYHPIRLFMYSAPLRATLDKPLDFLKSSKAGSLLLDYNDKTLTQMANRGEIPKDMLPEITRRRGIVDIGIKNGFNVGRISENLYTDLIQKVPGIGKYNRWLFDHYQRGLMAETYVVEFDRVKKMWPDKTQDEVGRMVAKDLNTRFGNLMSQSWIKSKTFTDVLRMFFLAPQWNEGLIRSELGAYTQAVKIPIDAAFKRRIASGALVRDAGILFAAVFVGNQVINYMTRGKPTWENDDKYPNAKISAYLPDDFGDGPGFFINPMALPAEITHSLVQRYERSGDFGQAVNEVVNNKLSSLGRAANVLRTGEDWRKNKLKDWDRVTEAIKEGLPVPMQTPIIADALKGKESYPGSREQQTLSAIGIKTDIATQSSPALNLARRIMADKFPHVKLDPEKEELYQKEGKAVKDIKAGRETLQDALKKGEVDQSRRKIVQEKVKETSLQYLLKHFSVDDAMSVYEQADEEERKSIKIEIRKKIVNAPHLQFIDKQKLFQELEKPTGHAPKKDPRTKRYSAFEDIDKPI